VKPQTVKQASNVNQSTNKHSFCLGSYTNAICLRHLTLYCFPEHQKHSKFSTSVGTFFS